VNRNGTFISISANKRALDLNSKQQSAAPGEARNQVTRQGSGNRRPQVTRREQTEMLSIVVL
jgi:hypothetical protein